MIDILTNNENLQVIKYNGQLMCSLRDPIKAAGTWLAHFEQSYHDNIAEYDLIFVVGLGSGYELKQFVTKYKNIRVIVVDTSPILFDRIKKIHPILDEKIEFMCVSSMNEFFNNQLIAENISKLYAVAKINFSLRPEKYLFSEIYKAFTVRTSQSFSKYIARYEKLEKLISKTKLNNSLKENELISVLNLNESLDEQNLRGQYSIELLKVLKELVV
ncbi:MAG: hypothetical protein HOO06_09295 [Bdellovibrionaceae bacterium]|jgi:hypothetical protein|nr:hypothetical protein [Pseudobdellovibrionaceae bacterium]